MFNRSNEVLLKPYGRRRSRWRIPQWLLLLLIGIAGGAAGVIVIQERYLPPRLSASASAELRIAFEQADAVRRRLSDDLAEMTTKLGDAAASRAAVQQLQGDLAFAVGALPPDPRGGSVEVRAGQFTAKAGSLAYEVALTRERAVGKPLPATLQLMVAGEAADGVPKTLALPPISLMLGSHEVVRGTVALPAGFKARQTTIQILHRPAKGPLLGTRTLLVR